MNIKEIKKECDNIIKSPIGERAFAPKSASALKLAISYIESHQRDIKHWQDPRCVIQQIEEAFTKPTP